MYSITHIFWYNYIIGTESGGDVPVFVHSATYLRVWEKLDPK